MVHDDGNDDKSYDLETVHEDVLGNDPVLPLRVLEGLLEDPVHLALVHEGPQSRQPGQPQQLCNAGAAAFALAKHLERDGGHDINDQRALEVPLGDLLVVADVLERLLVLVLLEEC